MNKLAEALQRAKEAGVANPTYRVAGLRITMAKADSQNPGYLYIKDSDYAYLGKIAPSGNTISYNGKTAILSEWVDQLKIAIDNPESIAMAEGKSTGICSCCGRTLTNKLSVELGIGPICRGYFFPEPAALDLGDLQHDLEFAGSEDLMDPEDLQDSFNAAMAMPVIKLKGFDAANKEAQFEIVDILGAYWRLEPSERFQLLQTILKGEIK